MKYNSISLRRQKTPSDVRQDFNGCFSLPLSRLFSWRLIIVSLWAIISAIDISANAPTMEGQAPVYWENNLINLFIVEQ